MPQSMSGRKLLETDLKKRFGLWVVGVKDVMSGKLTMFPDAEFRLSEDQMLLLVGKDSDLRRFQDHS
ncbi:MAG: TrkA C-terminal domain-containing protein [Pirellula sp.]|jgi:trk system potassium uptake protein TrkA|nr:TrkA C-terminal domain-containing protein [Pirellula sp.]